MGNNKVGIIGVGLMGHGIAYNIAKSGWPISYLDHPGNQPTDDLDKLGALSCATGADIARDCDVVILCVTGTPQIEDVLTRSDGVLAGITDGTVVIDCSTAIPTSTIEIALKVKAAGGVFLDAPMTRTPKEAAEGRLNLIVGGEEDLFKEHLPLLQAFAENITYAGAVGSGHTLKLIHNFVSLGFSAVLAEAATAAEKSGIDPSILLDVLENGGGRGVILDRFRSYLLARDPEGFVFSLSNAAKDTGYYHSMVRELAVSEQVASAVKGIYEGQVKAGEGNRYIPELISLLR
ncbi:NAD(P)-dependent oxidoreductase [Arenibacterium halophilum]|uniref:NAD(P)-dependent oxidoreductase n=1 Tax=Arenibacterium halophilum TaxID=2583821 RepID=A0ABY2WZI2_9RHOB|nr:NAD(P)-dependent oxidoreductase [Arenibacterium halophilum]TMV08312.1 NAD(P)-dependent oxidoreductase [Arenibacterium halophilum]